jgi:aconitate hydratase
MGVLPLTFKEGTDRKSLGITGEEIIDITGIHDIKPRMDLTLVIHRPNGKVDQVPVTCRIDTIDEVAYYQHGGILQYVLREMAKAA